MSKLEDKLTASIKPTTGKASSRKAAAQSPRQAPAKPVAAPSPAPKVLARPADLNDPAPTLHPARIWPD